MKVYIAGPLFTEAERALLEEIDEVCQAVGLKTYLPHRDAGLFSPDDADSVRRLFEHDLRQIEDSDIVIAVLNGSDVDAGTSWEAGFAFAKHKIIVGHLNDIRIFDPGMQINLMIINSLHTLTKTLPELREVLEGITK